MLELLHAVITSLLLSAAMGCGADQSATGDDEPANSETGIELGKLVTQLAQPRDSKPQPRDDNDQPPALTSVQMSFCEPSVWVGASFVPADNSPLAVGFPTAGRSP